MVQIGSGVLMQIRNAQDDDLKVNCEQDGSEPENVARAEGAVPGKEEEILLVLPTPARRRAEDFLPEWLRRLSRG